MPFKNLAREIELVCYDFDGVMTDNRVLVLEDGTEGVIVSRADGWAIARMHERGIPQIIVSTETNPVVGARAAKLGLPVIQGLSDKAAAVADYAAQHDHDLARTVFIGNDVNDLAIMQAVGYPVAPADSHPRILAVAGHVTKAIGGAGVIREFYETLIEGET